MLQEKASSPFLISLFIPDIENYFIAAGNRTDDILMLLYADDLFTLSDSPSNIDKTLRLLEKHFESNELGVSLRKTKTVRWTRGPSKVSFILESKILDMSADSTIW